MKKYLLFTLSFLILCIYDVKAQNPSSVNPPNMNMNRVAPSTPEATTGASAGAVLSSATSPDLYTGVLNINIPIYKGVKGFGVSLTYNTKGVHVNEYATAVGLHWNLNCGGSIVRTVRDIPDEILLHTDSLLIGDTATLINAETHVYGKLLAWDEGDNRLNAPNAYVDKECDRFDVSLGGSQFSFFIGNGFTVFTKASDNFKVQLLEGNTPVTNISQLSGHSEDNLNFKIVDNKGNKYYFTASGGQDTFKTLQKFYDWSVDPLFLALSNLPWANNPHSLPNQFIIFPTNWQLSKVVLADGRAIHYHYSLNKYYTNPGSTGPHIPSSEKCAYENYFVAEDNGISPYYLGKQKVLAKHWPAITQIDYPNNDTVYFIYDPSHLNSKGDFMLSQIKVSSWGDCKRFQLFQNADSYENLKVFHNLGPIHSYYTYYDTLIGHRTYLDSIKQYSCDTSKIEPYYSFKYDKTLPDRLNSGIDLYGYYNGSGSGTEIWNQAHTFNSGRDITIPKHNQGYGHDRSYDSQKAKAGLLTIVSNAYGGTEQLYYGHNVISSIPLSNLIPPATNHDFLGRNQPDGVRIDSIIKTDRYHPGYRQKTTFDYAGGQLFLPGGYFHYPVYIDSQSNAWQKVYFQSMFLTPHQFVRSSNHGYSTVNIRNYADNKLLSRRTIEYTNMQDALTGKNATRYYHVPGSKDYFEYPYTQKQYLKDWEMGLPYIITDYDQNNRIVKKTINKYKFTIDYSDSVSNVRTVKVNSGTKSYSIRGFQITPNWVNYNPYYPYKKIITDNYYPYKGYADLTRSITLKFISDTRGIADTVWYEYDDRNNLTKTKTENSKGQKTVTNLIYNYNVDGTYPLWPVPVYNTPGYASHPGTTLFNMTDAGLEYVVATERWRLMPPPANPQHSYSGIPNLLLSSFITKYHYENGKLWTKGLYNTQIGQPLSYHEYTGVLDPMMGFPYHNILTVYNTDTLPKYFIKTSSVEKFDENGHPKQTQLKGKEIYKSMIWDVESGHKMAEASNCKYKDIAYTSFENSSSETNFTINNHNAIRRGGLPGVTGTKVAGLWPQFGSKTVIQGTQNLDTGKKYILSFWVRLKPILQSPIPPYTFSLSPPKIEIGTNQTVPVAAQNIVYKKPVNPNYHAGNDCGWVNYQVRFKPNTSGKIKMTGTQEGTEIDEIRLYPAKAQMKSWTYTPLFGKSSYTDPSGRIIYFLYDKMGRLNVTLNQDGNIISKTDYHIAR